MKTLSESIINELRIADASTGNKLKYKTFGELKPGDKFYFVNNLIETIEEATWIVIENLGKTREMRKGYTDLNPDKKEIINCDLSLKIKNENNQDWYNSQDWYIRNVPFNVTYLTDGSSVYATSQELLLQILKKYNIASPLI